MSLARSMHAAPAVVQRWRSVPLATFAAWDIEESRRGETSPSVFADHRVGEKGGWRPGEGVQED